MFLWYIYFILFWFYCKQQLLLDIIAYKQNSISFIFHITNNFIVTDDWNFKKIVHDKFMKNYGATFFQKKNDNIWINLYLQDWLKHFLWIFFLCYIAANISASVHIKLLHIFKLLWKYNISFTKASKGNCRLHLVK